MTIRYVSTAQILAWPFLGLPCGYEHVNWAIGMLAAGRDSPSLRKLAMVEEPYKDSELAPLRDRALNELGMTTPPRDEVIRNYVVEGLRASLDDRSDIRTTFAVAADIWLCAGEPPELLDFHLLHQARRELETSDHQSFWPEATRRTIESLMEVHARAFIAKRTEQYPEAPRDT